MFRKINYFFYFLIFFIANQSFGYSCREVLEGSINSRIKAQLPNFQKIFDQYENSPDFIRVANPSPEIQSFIEDYFNGLVLKIGTQLNYLLHEKNYSLEEIESLRHYLLKFITNKKYPTESAIGIALDLSYSELPLNYRFSFQLGFLRSITLIDDEINFKGLRDFISNYKNIMYSSFKSPTEINEINFSLLQSAFGKTTVSYYPLTTFTHPLETILELNTLLSFNDVQIEDLLVGTLKNGASSILSEIESQLISSKLNQIEYIGLHSILRILSLAGQEHQVQSTFFDPIPDYINSDLKKYISLSLFESGATRKKAILMLRATLKKLEENKENPTKFSLNQAFILARTELKNKN